MMNRGKICFLFLILLLVGCTGQSREGKEADVQEEIRAEEAFAGDEEAEDAEAEEEGAGTESQGEPASEPRQISVETDKEAGAFFAESEKEAEPLKLTLISKEDNHISNRDDWLDKNRFVWPKDGMGLHLGSYSYIFYGNSDNPYGFNSVCIFEEETQKPLCFVDFSQDLGEEYGSWAEYSPEEDILYISDYYNGYASANSCFLMAADLEKGEILWRSEDQTYNSESFLLLGDVILCGYGFTAEEDYLYQLDRHTGKVISQYPLDTAPDGIFLLGNRLYVHTYHTDYVFEVEDL